jgi:hypothetical protein
MGRMAAEAGWAALAQSAQTAAIRERWSLTAAERSPVRFRERRVVPQVPVLVLRAAEAFSEAAHRCVELRYFAT